jgi:hypothetical protein
MNTSYSFGDKNINDGEVTFTNVTHPIIYFNQPIWTDLPVEDLDIDLTGADQSIMCAAIPGYTTDFIRPQPMTPYQSIFSIDLGLNTAAYETLIRQEDVDAIDVSSDRLFMPQKRTVLFELKSVLGNKGLNADSIRFLTSEGIRASQRLAAGHMITGEWYSHSLSKNALEITSWWFSAVEIGDQTYQSIAYVEDGSFKEKGEIIDFPLGTSRTLIGGAPIKKVANAEQSQVVMSYYDGADHDNVLVTFYHQAPLVVRIANYNGVFNSTTRYSGLGTMCSGAASPYQRDVSLLSYWMHILSTFDLSIIDELKRNKYVFSGVKINQMPETFVSSNDYIRKLITNSLLMGARSANPALGLLIMLFGNDFMPIIENPNPEERFELISLIYACYRSCH